MNVINFFLVQSFISAFFTAGVGDNGVGMSFLNVHFIFFVKEDKTPANPAINLGIPNASVFPLFFRH